MQALNTQKPLAPAKNICHVADMNATQIIDAFGGRPAMATLTGANEQAVRQWGRIGVPSKYWHVLVRRAAETGVAGVTFEVLAATKAGKS
jgi:hypothetical protein